MYPVDPGSKDEQLAKLKRSAPFRGRLVDARSGKGLKGVHILNGATDKAHYFMWGECDTFADGHHSLQLVQRGSSGDDGSFAFSEGLRPGTLFIIHPGYARLILKPDERKQATPDTGIPVALEPEATVSGRVVGPLAKRTNLSVQLYSIKRSDKFSEEFEKIPLDANKGFRFPNLAAGEYFLAVYRSEDTVGFSAMNRRFTLKTGDHKTLNVGSDMGPFTLSGRTAPFTMISLRSLFD